jgi:hypothetical protein
MRSILVISFLLSAISCFSQRILSLDKRVSLAHQQPKLAFDTTGFHLLPKVEYFCDSGNRNAWDYYHVVDLNGDGLKDLIYSGPCKPYDQAGIFLNDGNALKQVHNYPGSVISIDRNSSATTIQIFKKACCCDPFSSLIEVTIDDQSNVTKDLITFSRDTEIPGNLQLKEISVKGILRSKPEVDDKMKKDDCTDRLLKGNHLVTITTPQEVTQVYQSGNWKLVVYQENIHNTWIGWIDDH